jgi:hypothetical protein
MNQDRMGGLAMVLQCGYNERDRNRQAQHVFIGEQLLKHLHTGSRRRKVLLRPNHARSVSAFGRTTVIGFAELDKDG